MTDNRPINITELANKFREAQDLGKIEVNTEDPWTSPNGFVSYYYYTFKDTNGKLIYNSRQLFSFKNVVVSCSVDKKLIDPKNTDPAGKTSIKFKHKSSTENPGIYDSIKSKLKELNAPQEELDKWNVNSIERSDNADLFYVVKTLSELIKAYMSEVVDMSNSKINPNDPEKYKKLLCEKSISTWWGSYVQEVKDSKTKEMKKLDEAYCQLTFDVDEDQITKSRSFGKGTKWEMRKVANQINLAKNPGKYIVSGMATKFANLNVKTKIEYPELKLSYQTAHEFITHNSLISGVAKFICSNSNIGFTFRPRLTQIQVFRNTSTEVKPDYYNEDEDTGEYIDDTMESFGTASSISGILNKASINENMDNTDINYEEI